MPYIVLRVQQTFRYGKNVALVSDSNIIKEMLGYSQLLSLKMSSEKKDMTIASHHLIRRRCRYAKHIYRVYEVM